MLNSTHSPVIAVVDDEAPVRRLLRRCLESEGFEVREAADRQSLFRVLAAGDVDLITLDLMLGPDNGLDIAREVRAGFSVAIIMVTGKSDVVDTVVGLEVGADDYICKPFELREVIARVRSVLRRTGRGDAPGDQRDAALPLREFDGWVLALDTRELLSPVGSSCVLTTSEFELLALLVEYARTPLSRDRIMELTRGHQWDPSDRSIDNTVTRLRRKLDTHENAGLIKTVRGVGYLFTPEIRQTARR